MAARSRRSWLAHSTAMLAASCAWTPSLGAQTVVEQRSVAGFHALLWSAAGELQIEQSGRERLSIEAEPAVLAKIVTEVRDGRLSIGFAPGRIETRLPIRFRLEVKSLSAIEGQGSGRLRIGPLTGNALSLHLAASDELHLARLSVQVLDARLDGSGDVTIDAGQVDRQRIVISGAGNYSAARMDSREADVAIDGSGEIQVAVSERLVARIAGSGDVLYSGQPRISQTIRGAGEVRRVAQKS